MAVAANAVMWFSKWQLMHDTRVSNRNSSTQGLARVPFTGPTVELTFVNFNDEPAFKLIRENCALDGLPSLVLA
ncbi:MAG: hypothetical protein P4L40_04400 [Terracidiphilus sp.]|jgi:hypothetical protein|nr:hypothetical protein [Terracidiphilus sp.]